MDPVLANPPRLQRVLHNLLSNALSHTPADGTMAVESDFGHGSLFRFTLKRA